MTTEGQSAPQSQPETAQEGAHQLFSLPGRLPTKVPTSRPVPGGQSKPVGVNLPSRSSSLSLGLQAQACKNYGKGPRSEAVTAGFRTETLSAGGSGSFYA